MHDIVERGIRLVTNAGGLDPLGLKQAIEEVQGFDSIKVGHDDVL
jgi:hypothetical protein